MPSMWKKAMVYLGLADDDEYGDYGDYEEEAEGPPARGTGYPQQQYTQAPAYGDNAGTVRTLPRDEPAREAQPYQPQSSAVKTLPAEPSARLHLVTPTDFDGGAKEVGDRFKGKNPVIMNLSLCENQIARRLLDFASGLTYGLSGKVKKVGEGVFLLTPAGVEVSAEEKRRLRVETGILFDEFDH